MKSLRCRMDFHRWKGDAWREDWQCERCQSQPKVCTNCGGRHDPTALLVICRVTR